MKHLFSLFTLIVMSLSAIAGDKVTLNDVMYGGYWPQTYAAIKPMADGVHFARMSNDRSMILKGSFKNGEIVDTLFNAATARGFEQKHIDGYQFSPDEQLILLQTKTKSIYRNSFTAEHYIYSRKNNKVEALSQNGAQQVPKFSPDGTMIAFVRDNNIFLVKLLFGNAESQVTTDGEFRKIINGIPDWVNEEEFMNNCSYDFSADSKMIAYIKYDESEVMMYDMPMYIPTGAPSIEYDDFCEPYSFKYPVAGAANSKISVHSFDIKSRVTRKLGVNIPEEGYIPRIKFTKNPDALAVLTLNRHQSILEIQAVNPRSGISKTILREESDTYLNEQVYTGIEFYDKHFVFQSERSGYNHLYLYTIDGMLVRPITKGEFEVKHFYGWDSNKNEFYYSSNEGSPLREYIYKVNAKGKKTKLTAKEGTNSAVFSAGMKYFINTHSNISTPHTVTTNDNNGKVIKTLVDNANLKERLAKFDMPTKEFFTFTTTDGVELNGWMVKPADFNASKKYPVVMFQYSGPYSQQVNDKWYMGNYGNAMFESYMAGEGFIMVCVDGRGTGGRGTEFGKCTYLNIGKYEPGDQVEAAKYLGSLPYVDKNNIGIWGWSFGGYNTLMSMSQDEAVFKAGVAVAAPTDWRFYDTVYTERYMRTPKENKEGYDAGSAIVNVNKLSGNLLLVHGTADDNVHLRNMIRYTHALTQANKKFEMALYPDSNHSIYYGRNTRYHLFEKIAEFFKANLK
ncbi:MAG: S9 family peptidase [Bacteroidaceae bacterium]|nr:S9 family peptidase [Bacteroidaceae bacterium]